MKLLIKSVEIWSEKEKAAQDILIEDGKIRRVEKGIKEKVDLKIDGSSCVALPLFVDLHAHLRYPGEENKEELETGLKAALKGGFSAVVAMPNTKPVIDNPYLVKHLMDQAKRFSGPDVFVAAAITEGEEGKRKTSFEELVKAGAKVFSDDGKCVMDSRIMYDAAREAARLKVPLMLHEEDYGFSNNSCINEGYASYRTGIKGNHYLSETAVAVRDMLIARDTGAKIHIQHVSAKETVNYLKMFKNELITSEVTPHHLLFDESHTLSLNPLYKVNPPLRKKEDREALLEALNEGVIDCIATDHAPHTAEEKMQPYSAAPPGMVWFELFFPAIYSLLILKGHLSTETFVRAAIKNPSLLLGRKPAEIREGEAANLALFDVSKKVSLKETGSVLKSTNNPLFEEPLYGFTKAVVLNGKLRFLDGRFREGEVLDE